MRRRSFVRRAAGAVVGTAAVGDAVGADDGFQQVSTRGHFGVNWRLQTELQDGHGPREYETSGSIPGYHTDETPDELVVFVHGWLQNESDVETRFPKQREALRTAGADGPVVSYSWDSDSTEVGWWVASEIARRNGAKLATFLADYAQRSSGTRLRVIGSSLGGRLVPSAMAALHDRDAGRIVDTVSLLGAAVPVEAVGLDGTYGPGLDANAASVDNFWKSDDLALEASFRLAELTGAVGSNGLPDGDEPAGYTDHRVDYVESHQDYWKVDTGCAKALVDAW